jgi:hypothetical protein
MLHNQAYTVLAESFMYISVKKHANAPASRELQVAKVREFSTPAPRLA